VATSAAHRGQGWWTPMSAAGDVVAPRNHEQEAHGGELSLLLPSRMPTDLVAHVEAA
jgi:hypothetical protein